jgi:hypothetical protein
MQSSIVSAFVSNVDENTFLNKYYENGKSLLKSSTPKIVFLDESIIHLFTDYDKTNTHIIQIQKTSLYLHDYKSLVTNFNINTTSSLKDIVDYMLIICNKTEWVKKSVLLNPFNTDNFVWVDFGIRHIFNLNSEDEFIHQLNLLQFKHYSKIRIGSIWDTNTLVHQQHHLDIYKDVFWYFAGGVFGGNKELLIIFADVLKNVVIQTIKNKNTIVWEVNLWYLVFLDCPELFDCYQCDHNPTLISNY